MVMLNLEAPQAIPVTIDVGGDSFSIMLQPPTLQDRLTDDSFFYQLHGEPSGYQAAFKGRVNAQLERVIGWNGLDGPGGNPLPFTKQNLTVILAKYPDVLSQLSLHLSRLYSAVPASLGELPASLNGSQTAEASAAAASDTPSLQPTPSA